MAKRSPSIDEYSDSHKSSQSILQKGRACANCRRRKMKCDGMQPICGSCIRTGKAEDCEYTTGSERSTSQKLEEQLHLLQTRLRNLQNPPNSHQSIALQQPYRPVSAVRHTISGFQEPPRRVSQKLLDIFLAHASQYGFFLHPGRFRSAVQGSEPIGHESRPSVSLLSTMYLLGIHFSQDPEMKRHEKMYFDLAIQYVSQDISSPAHPKHRVHVLQAELLLAQYFFSNQRPVEGRYHANSAYSLAIASGIHRMRVRNPHELTLPPANDDIEEGERVNAFWEVFCIDKGWGGVYDCDTIQGCFSPTGSRLLTPMPREIEEYETGRYRCECRSARTLDDFTCGNESPGETLSSRELHVKATLLFERGCALSRAMATDLRMGKQTSPFEEKLSKLRDLAVNLKSSLPPFETLLRNQNPDVVRTVYVGMTLLDAALIRINGIAAAVKGEDKAYRQRVVYAEDIFKASIKLASASWNFGVLNPIIGYAWREAFNVLYDEATRSAAQSSWSAPQVVQNEDPLRRQLRKGVSSFATYSNSSRFIGSEVDEMTNILQSTLSY